jgi:D-alanyl-D-alanine endopeptidase (penicillin-binding protein 7)
MRQTAIEEPTGLSPNNRSTASDLVKMATAASKYPEIARITTEKSDIININGRGVEYRNTNRLVGAKGWDIGLSKTGYTEEAGRCLIMNIKAAGKNATMILLNAGASSARILDALNVRRFITRSDKAQVTAGAPPRVFKASAGPGVFKASAAGPRVKMRASSRVKVKATAGGKAKVKVAPRVRARNIKERRRA